jgi:large subunit ribosomal protein L25
MAKITAKLRMENGSRAAKRLRAEGKVPGIVYGHGQAPQSLTLDMHEIVVAIRHHERVLEMELEGKNESVMFREVQYDSLGDDILHIDLTRVNLDEIVRVTVPVNFIGTAAGMKEGGVLQVTCSDVTIECTVRNMPEEIRHNIESLALNGHVYAKDLVLPEGAKLVDDADELLCSITTIAEEAVAAPAEGAEGAGEPEVIGAKKEEEGEADAKGKGDAKAKKE